MLFRSIIYGFCRITGHNQIKGVNLVIQIIFLMNHSIMCFQLLGRLKEMVDDFVPNKGKYEVATDSNGQALCSNLLCTRGTSNKYYIIQVLREIGTRDGSYILYRRWGRCHTNGKKVQNEYGDVKENRTHRTKRPSLVAPRSSTVAHMPTVGAFNSGGLAWAF